MAEEIVSELEMQAWQGFLLTHDAMRRGVEAGLAEAGLALGEYEVLRALGEAGKEGIRMSDLAAYRFMSTGGLTRLADRLEGRGLIERQRVDCDKRSFVVVLTTEGRRTLRRARRRHHEDIKRLFADQLDEDDLRALARAWGRFEGSSADGSC